MAFSNSKKGKNRKTRNSNLKTRFYEFYLIFKESALLFIKKPPIN